MEQEQQKLKQKPEAVLFRVEEDGLKKHFVHDTGEARYSASSIPLDTSFANGHVKAEKLGRVVADFDICETATGILWNAQGSNAERISYLDGLIGAFDSVNVVGSSELRASDFVVGDSVTLTLPADRLQNWLESIKVPGENKTLKSGARFNPDDAGFAPGK